MPDSFQPEDLAWIILLLPLLAAAVIGLGTRRDARLSARLSITAVVLSFLGSLGLFLLMREPLALAPKVETSALEWLSVGALKVDLALRLDPLSLLMLLVVTGVGGAIHIYSWGYMHGDRCVGRFFGCLSLFMFSMLGIVLANNFLMMFIFWELVGVSSYLLIGFWYERPAAADACKKAFITNRLGDFGFLLGILIIWAACDGLNFDAVQARLAKSPETLGALASLAGFLIFMGAMGKSAQFPLHVWLPDAMEGPTPVSALIHAATMVAAGVYMLCRVFFLFTIPQAWPELLAFLDGWTALGLIAWLGGLTALLAALMAVQQDDIKRILAYSTLSQLGYMVMAVGLGGPTPAMYHLTTHAFFKALLFLGAGSVIHAMHHEQDIWRMGGLREKLPVTWRTFLLGTLALCGVPPLSGFYSKDGVLAQAYHQHVILFILAVFVAMLTAFYMSRLVVVAFLGSHRSEQAGHAHESPGVMTWPLVVLAVPTVLAGLWGLDAFLERQFNPAAAPHAESWVGALFAPFGHAPAAALLGLAATVFGFSFAWALYRGAVRDPLPDKLGALARAMAGRFYFDELYRALIALTHEALARLAAWCDQWIVAGLAVRGVHGSVELLGRALRLVQTGNLQTYAFLFVAGVVVVLFFALR
ncbi:MAG TPA: NADH-quinone oxidoreductase subunit L [Methylomirabilota bacterium]|nr:NADH-quinone oxidoreductase subunit L [Methylomirabilota bacterium]